MKTYIYESLGLFEKLIINENYIQMWVLPNDASGDQKGEKH